MPGLLRGGSEGSSGKSSRWEVPSPPDPLLPLLPPSIDKDKDRFPEKLAFAECLCKGCIDSKTGAETSALNSVPVLQSMMVLQRKPCQHSSDSPGFAFEVRYIKVPVACTCALPRSSG